MYVKKNEKRTGKSVYKNRWAILYGWKP